MIRFHTAFLALTLAFTITFQVQASDKDDALEYAKVLHEKRDCYRSLIWVEKAELIQIDAQTLKQKADCMSRLGKHDDAFRLYQESYRLDPTDAKVAYNIGFYLDDLNEYVGAVRHYGHAISIDSNYASAYFNRAMAYQNLQAFEKSIEDFNHYLRIVPEDYAAYYQRAQTHLKMKNILKAKSDLTKALDLKQNDVMVMYSLAGLEEQSGEKKHALALYNKVFKRVGVKHELGKLVQQKIVTLELQY